jgi:hypothetical protein
MSAKDIHKALQQVSDEIHGIETFLAQTFSKALIQQIETALEQSQMTSLQHLRTAMTTFNQLQIGQYPHASQVLKLIRETRLPQAREDTTEVLNQTDPLKWD